MSLEHNNPGNDLLERAVSVLRDADVPNGPSPELVEKTLARMDGGVEPNQPRLLRRLIQMKSMTKLAVAAAVVIAFGTFSFWGLHQHGSSVAFAEILKTVRQVHSVCFKGTSVVQVPGIAAQTVTTDVLIVDGGRMRQTVQPSGMVMIWDWSQGRCLSLEPLTKRATVMEMSNLPPEQKQSNLLDIFRQLDESCAAPLEDKVVAGRTAKGFKVVTPGQEMTIWADPQTRLPLQVEQTLKVGMLPTTTMTMTDFVWDQPVDESLLSLSPPEGYESQTFKMDLGPAAEQDLLNALKAAAEFNDGKFPADLSLVSIAGAAGKRMVLAMAEPAKKKELEAQMMQAMSLVGRGWMFINDPKNGEDFRYAGKDVPLNQAGTPILWYQPNGAATYRVIDADLTIRDVQPSELPTGVSTALRPASGPADGPQQ
ncbi:MAG TPA: hypothetical protein PKY77_18715 [Phycisphaerae bacterium]|nr:hypothetical protein [Phycisphaerae bacterium]HRY66388.1 hypothetical protein [Phycisphaerae bacterium]HSA25905.1 hypothetical protein [Phycisphaerae bacterium]